MTEEERNKCHAIIHSSALAAAGGNAVPAPGLGFAVDITTMTTMAMSLASVFGGDISREAAKAMAIATLKRTMLKQPLKTIGKELAKLIPFGGQVFAAGISAAMVEAAGWSIAKQLDAKRNVGFVI